jgi:hypothetical protein
MIYCKAGTKATPASVLGVDVRFLNWYVFRFSITLWKVFVIELRDSVVFSAVHCLHCPWQTWCIVHRWNRSRRRLRLLDLYGFRFFISLWNVFEPALRDAVVFLVTQTVLSTFDVYCAYGSAHTFVHLNYLNLPVYYLIRGSVLQGLCEVRLDWNYSR